MPPEDFGNPLIFESIPDLLLSVLSALLVMALPIVVFFIVYSGFLYVVGRGNPEKIKKASISLMYSLIGGVIIIGALTITEIIKNTVNQF